MGKPVRMLFSSLQLEQNDLVIVDTAAGVEHFGRSLDGQCDHILCVVDPSYESIMMAKRVGAFAREAGLPVSVVFNRVTSEVDKVLSAALENVAIIGRIPDSRSILLKQPQGQSTRRDMPEMESVCGALEEAWL